MNKIKETAVAVYRSAVVRRHALDLLKVVAGVILAHYGIKLA